MPRPRYWLAMYLVMTLAVSSGIYLGGRLLLAHESTAINATLGMSER